jgi:hypothetical protein
MAETYQNYESLVLVISKALGSGKNKGGDAPKTADEMEARMAKAFG